MRSQVSGEVELKCLRLPGGLSGGCPDGVPNLPFYRLREGLGVHERERRKRRKRKTGEKKALELRRPSSRMSGSRWLDDDEDDSMS
jgi:hypothetical protein